MNFQKNWSTKQMEEQSGLSGFNNGFIVTFKEIIFNSEAKDIC